MSYEHPARTPNENAEAQAQGDDNPASADGGALPEKEIGGRDGPDPTRYGDWEKNGRCIDF